MMFEQIETGRKFASFDMQTIACRYVATADDESAPIIDDDLTCRSLPTEIELSVSSDR